MSEEIKVDPQLVIDDLLNRITALTKEVCFLNAALKTEQSQPVDPIQVATNEP